MYSYLEIIRMYDYLRQVCLQLCLSSLALILNRNVALIEIIPGRRRVSAGSTSIVRAAAIFIAGGCLRPCRDLDAAAAIDVEFQRREGSSGAGAVDPVVAFRAARAVTTSMSATASYLWLWSVQFLHLLAPPGLHERVVVSIVFMLERFLYVDSRRAR